MATTEVSSTKSTKPEGLFPKTWPGGFGLYKYSKQAMQDNVWILVGTYVVYVIVGLILTKIGTVGSLLNILTGTFFTAMFTIIWLTGSYGKKADFAETAKQAGEVFLKFLGLTIVTGVVCTLAFLLLIVPFFFVFPRLILAEYFLIDKKMGIMEAFNASWDATKGHVSKVYGVIFVGIGITLLAITIIGIPFAIYFGIMYSAATAVLYHHINSANASKPAVAAPVTE